MVSVMRWLPFRSARGSHVRYGPSRRGHKRWLSAIAITCLFLSALPVLADPVTIAALGDSLTQGYGLPPGDGLVPQLQAWLDRQGVETVVLNAGVSGDTTAGGLARVDWTLTPDIDALIVSLGGNDFLRGLDPKVTRENLDAILGKADAAGLPVLLIGLHASRNYGADYQRDFDAIFPELAARHGALLYPSFFDALGSGAGAVDGGLMQADGIHPNKAGVARVVEAIGPVVLQLVERAQK
jgi:acyl-CoA thioesterase-1